MNLMWQSSNTILRKNRVSVHVMEMSLIRLSGIFSFGVVTRMLKNGMRQNREAQRGSIFLTVTANLKGAILGADNIPEPGPYLVSDYAKHFP